MKMVVRITQHWHCLGVVFGCLERGPLDMDLDFGIPTGLRDPELIRPKA